MVWAWLIFIRRKAWFLVARVAAEGTQGSALCEVAWRGTFFGRTFGEEIAPGIE
jgi:hypothetical protein